MGNKFIISSLSTRKDTQLINICQRTGNIFYNGIIGEDLFASEEDALHYLTTVQKITFKFKKKFPALIGMCYFANTNSMNILIATKVIIFKFFNSSILLPNCILGFDQIMEYFK